MPHVDRHRPASHVDEQLTARGGHVVGEGAIIGMGTVLSGEIPPMSIVVGSRWRVVGTRDAAHYEDCVKRQAFGGPNGMRLAGELAPS